MRLKQYLDIKDYAKTLKKDCKPYIRESENLCMSVYRGAEELDNNETLIRKKSRIKNRKPMDTHITVHKYFNKKFTQRFGWPVRNGVFTIGMLPDTGYGSVDYIFFPIGKYEYVWSPKYRDFTEDLDLDKSEWDDESLDRDDESLDIHEMISEKEVDSIISTYQSTDLQKAIRSKHEISFNCKEYYLLQAKPDKDVIKYLLDQ